MCVGVSAATVRLGRRFWRRERHSCRGIRALHAMGSGIMIHEARLGLVLHPADSPSIYCVGPRRAQLGEAGRALDRWVIVRV
jgi:hypothetical protein